MEQRLKDLHKELMVRYDGRVIVGYSCSKYDWRSDNNIHNKYHVHLDSDTVFQFDTIEEMEKHFERDEILFRKF